MQSLDEQDTVHTASAGFQQYISSMFGGSSIWNASSQGGLNVLCTDNPLIVSNQQPL